MEERVKVIGAGIAGSEAAYQLAELGLKVDLYEMRPEKMTPVHTTDLPAEIVCSNSLGSDSTATAPGLLKAELRELNSLIMQAADRSKVPAGQALAVNREKFSGYIKQILESHENVRIINREVTRIPTEGTVVIASGPLTAPGLAGNIKEKIGSDYFFFYDAVSPIIMAESVNYSIAFEASRYGKGTPDYLNCPMSEEEYDAFYEALINAERVNPANFEEGHYFEGCMPVEEIASRGKKTLLFGPLKPVGLDDDATAVVQLRKENREATMYSLVGFQTRLKWSEQKRVFRMIPGLEKAEFARYGVMHRNSYIDSPRQLSPMLRLKSDDRVFFAGQITGVEGYMESAATGLLAGLYAAWTVKGLDLPLAPRETALGSLINYITDENTKNFQPMNVNFGILPPANIRAGKKERRAKVVDEALKECQKWTRLIKRKPLFLSLPE